MLLISEFNTHEWYILLQRLPSVTFNTINCSKVKGNKLKTGGDMVRSTAIIPAAMILLCSCYCKHFYNKESSVRFLRGSKVYTICYDPPGLKDGKRVVLTGYTTDTYYNKKEFSNNNGDDSISPLLYEPRIPLGLRAESYWALGSFPCPILGIGVDFSFHSFDFSFKVQNNGSNVEIYNKVKQQQLLLNLDYVTWINEGYMGYINFQPGHQWQQNNKTSLLTPNNTTTGNKTKLNLRVGYGIQYYIKRGIAFTIEAGYGAGAYFRGGVSVWAF